MSREQQRQGDVLFEPIAAIPEEAKAEDTNVIVEGETTGHAHRVRPSDMAAKNAVLMLVGAQMYLRAHKAVHIDHEDHGTNILPPGDYQIRRQVEHQPWGKRLVVD